MSTQIQYQAGNYLKFTATRTFALPNGMSISSGSELEFDGTNVIYGGGHPTAMPNLRGAVKTKWLVLTDSYDPDDLSSSVPVSANITMRDPIGGNPNEKPAKKAVTTVDAEEQEVGDVKAHASKTRANNSRRPGRRTASLEGSGSDGVPVRTLKTPAVADSTDLGSGAAAAIRAAESIKIEAGEGRTREDLLASMSVQERQEYLASLEAKKAQHVPESATPIVGRVAPTKNQQKEGFQINNSVGNGVETFDAGGATGEVGQSYMEVEGVRFSNTNIPLKAGKAKVVAPAVADARRKIALSICKDFPSNYNFDDAPKKKIARLQADYEDRPDIIRAVAAAETDVEVRSRLVEEFPSAFE